MNRREVLIGSGIPLSAAVAGCAGRLNSDGDGNATEGDASESPSAEVEIELSAQTDPEEFVVDAVSASVDGQLEIVDDEGATLAPAVVIEAGETHEEYAVQYTDPIDDQRDVTVRFVHDESVIETASTTVYPDLVDLERGEVTLVEARPEDGFNYPYFAYVPETIGSGGSIFVEPNNTGTRTDNFDEHLRSARALVAEDSWHRDFPVALGMPFLVPVFPRPETEPRSWRHYIHSLDAETMGIDSGPLERVDLQLLEMIDHYRNALAKTVGYDAAEAVHMNGFSASGNFVNRFTALHPERVRAVTAGAINGTAILPREAAKNESLPYPIGVADLPELIGDEFDETAWTEVPQYIYLGGEDENDTIPYDEAWNSRLRDIALDVYGEDMQADRMPYCESVYEEAGANAQFHIYDDVGHAITTRIEYDIYDFHRKHSDGAEFDPIEVRDKSGLEISFADVPQGGTSSVSVHLSVPEQYKTDGGLPNGRLSVLLDTGEEIDVTDSIRLIGRTSFEPSTLPVDETYTYETLRSLDSGEQLTVGILYGKIIASETITVR